MINLYLDVINLIQYITECFSCTIRDYLSLTGK